MSRCAGCSRCPAEIRTVNQQVGPGFFVQQQVQVESKEFCKMADAGISVDVPKGATAGTDYVMEALGEQRPGIIPGNVVVRIKQGVDAKFKRDGHNLHTTIGVSLTEALLGFSKQISHLDGSLVSVAARAVTQPNQVLRLEEEGMPNDDERGDLFVAVKVLFPSSLTGDQRERILNAFPDLSSPVHIKSS